MACCRWPSLKPVARTGPVTRQTTSAATMATSAAERGDDDLHTRSPPKIKTAIRAVHHSDPHEMGGCLLLRSSSLTGLFGSRQGCRSQGAERNCRSKQQPVSQANVSDKVGLAGHSFQSRANAVDKERSSVSHPTSQHDQLYVKGDRQQIDRASQVVGNPVGDFNCLLITGRCGMEQIPGGGLRVAARPLTGDRRSRSNRFQTAEQTTPAPGTVGQYRKMPYLPAYSCMAPVDPAAYDHSRPPRRYRY